MCDGFDHQFLLDIFTSLSTSERIIRTGKNSSLAGPQIEALLLCVKTY
jgi:hypothetical protein